MPAGAASYPAESNQANTHNEPAATPKMDALCNPYVRVVHTNGVHHIALVYCTCRGQEEAHSDLMAQRLIPTSFTRYRTLFTHAVLDDFRAANLECRTRGRPKKHQPDEAEQEMQEGVSRTRGRPKKGQRNTDDRLTASPGKNKGGDPPQLMAD